MKTDARSISATVHCASHQHCWSPLGWQTKLGASHAISNATWFLRHMQCCWWSAARSSYMRSRIYITISSSPFCVSSVPPGGKNTNPCGAPGYTFRMLSAPAMLHFALISTESSSKQSSVPQVKSAEGSWTFDVSVCPDWSALHSRAIYVQEY